MQPKSKPTSTCLSMGLFACQKFGESYNSYSVVSQKVILIVELGITDLWNACGVPCHQGASWYYCQSLSLVPMVTEYEVKKQK